jgi:P pilus assembly chaperone PapD
MLSNKKIAGKVRNRLSEFSFLIILLFLSMELQGQGDLLITPRRIVFSDSKKSIDLNLANSGKDTATYAISIIQIRMTENGGFENITTPDPGQLFADQYIRFFPRSVTLGPNEAQVVKVQLVRANQLAPGEYRSHFYFRAIPKPKPLGNVEAAAKDTTAISVVLTPVFGITIPVIIRVGEVSSKVTLSNMALTFTKENVPNLSLTFNRTGNMSVFGDLAVYHISTAGKETKVGIANGIAVYTPNQTRKFQFNLNTEAGVDYHSGTLRAVFSAPSDVKPERYAEAEVSLR